MSMVIVVPLIRMLIEVVRPGWIFPKHGRVASFKAKVQEP